MERSPQQSTAQVLGRGGRVERWQEGDGGENRSIPWPCILTGYTTKDTAIMSSIAPQQAATISHSMESPDY